MARIRIGDLLIKAGLIDDMQLTSALATQRQWGGRLGDILVDQGFLDEMMLYKGLAKQLGMKLVSLPDFEVQPAAVKALPRELASKYEVFPITLEGSTLTVATSNPGDVAAQDELSFRSGKRIRTVLAPAREIEWAQGRYYDGRTDPCPPPKTRRELPSFNDGAPVTSGADGPPPGFTMGFSDAELPVSDHGQGRPGFSPLVSDPGIPVQPNPGVAPYARPPTGATPRVDTGEVMKPPSQPMAALSAAQTLLGQVATPMAAVAAGRSLDEIEAELKAVTHLLRLVVDRCVARGLFTQEEYLARVRR